MPTVSQRSPYGDPGFYQGQLRGLKTGRPSPRQALRAPAETRIFAQHGMVDPGAADVNQGQLFDISRVPHPPEADVVRAAGAPPALPGGGHRGFMPGIERTNDTRTKAAKMTGINRLEDARARTGAHRGGSPISETLADRQAVYARGTDVPWYAEARQGSLGEGHAGRMIAEEAMKLGISHGQMARAVAVTSPRTGWVEGGEPGTTDYRRPNIDSAVSVVRAVQQSGVTDIAEAGEVGGEAHGKALDKMKAKAGREFARGEPTNPIPIANPASAKVPNFEQNLHLDSSSLVTQRQASRAYTVDVHDTTSLGGDEQMLATDTGYHVAAMTGRRAALQAGVLPPHFQSRTWETIRGAEQPESMGHNRLFTSIPRGPRQGQLIPNPNAIPPEHHEAAAQHFAQASGHRSEIAERLGLEF